MKYFDLHCDTAYEMFTKHQPLAKNTLSVDLDGFGVYDRKAQIFAVWSENTKPAGDVYGDFFAIFENLKNEIEKNAGRCLLCTDKETLAADDDRLKIIPAVEGARLLENDLSRLEILREYGVRVLTFGWEGESTVCGAYDTGIGLTDFGFRVLEECENLGILVDVSHLSEKGFWDVANAAKKPFFASHSNAAALCDHPRNLSDLQIRTVAAHGGIVGVDLVGRHLSRSLADGRSPDPETALAHVASHIVHILEKGGPKTCALGLDLDGTETLPGLEKVQNAGAVGEYLQTRGAPLSLVEDVFYENACRFFVKNL